MEEISNKLKSLIGNLSEILIAAIGLLVVVQVVFGTSGNLDVISNLTGLVDSFIGSGASLASLVTLVLIMGVLSKR
ncbi:MAG: hypothetical protein DBX01_01975 [Puniceicoccaceae bacterium]|nr:hypothetical protein [Puniceicoccaceae bacterium]RCL35840.1 MAG: hypothetical protein DBX01_01975 [Puniceicoccaceae bacterium]|tara:strand:- start:6137 stop:6364 length:228 start_codon:yes stop_codon:yes gene_type:complete